MGELSELREDIFGVEVKKHVLWEVVKWQLACRRQGTHSTKTRGEVAYSGRKILPQREQETLDTETEVLPSS